MPALGPVVAQNRPTGRGGADGGALRPACRARGADWCPALGLAGTQDRSNDVGGSSCWALRRPAERGGQSSGPCARPRPEYRTGAWGAACWALRHASRARGPSAVPALGPVLAQDRSTGRGGPMLAMAVPYARPAERGGPFAVPCAQEGRSSTQDRSTGRGNPRARQEDRSTDVGGSSCWALRRPAGRRGADGGALRSAKP